MKKFNYSSFFISTFSLFITIVWAGSSGMITPPAESFSPVHTFFPTRNDIPEPEKNSSPKERSKAIPLEAFAADTPVTLKYPMQDESWGVPSDNDYNGGLYLNNPSNVKTSITYDSDSNRYDVTQKMGTLDYRPPIYMTPDEYADYEFKKSLKDYWKQRLVAEDMNNKQQKVKNKNLIPPIKINSNVFRDIFGSNVVDIRPQGSAELIFGVNSSHTENPAIPVRQRRITTFDFDEKIQLSLVGKIGDRLKITTNYNTQATFDFENKMKLEYTGGEDDIIKKIEAGNVSMPLNSTLISGSQSLFGIKTQLQFGRTTVTAVVSQDKGQKKEIDIQNGMQTNPFTINGDAYEVNKHFFLAQYFKDRYDLALAHLPVVESAVNITKIEVWITNVTSNTTNTRNIIALTDLGEDSTHYLSNPSLVTAYFGHPVPENSANTLNPATFVGAHPHMRSKDTAVTILTNLGYRQVQDFEKVLLARQLSPSEFTFNPRLGFISLNTQVNPDQVIAVAYQYTYNGNTYQVGELSTDGVADPKCLMVKMLKSTNVDPRRDQLLWDLMMKNVYALGAYQIKPDNFRLDVLYNNPGTGTNVPVIPESGLAITGKPLIQVMNLDRINSNGDAVPDGFFDFIDGVTINAANGRVYFPVRKPFGQHLREEINPYNTATLNTIAEKYVFDQLYDSTKYAAQQYPDKNRFSMKGSFKSATGSEINLNAPNIPEHSVIVTAGGVPLTENVDYTVDYALGKVKIINDGILQSGTPIKITFESNLLFGFQQKTLLGTHVDYRVNKDFHLGATAMHLSQRPLTQKVTVGDEPVSNTVLGADANYRSEFPFLTRMIDKLPFYSTKTMSTIAGAGEVAALIPGTSRAIGKNGTSYIDDFEGSETPIDIKAVGAWFLASTPEAGNPLWPEGSRTDTVYGFNRAKLAWYTIDPMFMLQTANITPSYYNTSRMSDNYSRQIIETEIFPKKESPTGQPVPLPTLDLAFYPSERGQYNYNAETVNGIAAGTNTDGTLKSPQTRWGGITRSIQTTDFEAANVQYVHLWVMDPFNPDLHSTSGSQYNDLQTTSGELVIQLGNISEDVLKDGQKSFENGLPTNSSDAGNPNNLSHPYDITPWGRVPTTQAVVNAFDNDLTTRNFQDIGLDGLMDADEPNFFNKFISKLHTQNVNPPPPPIIQGAPPNIYDDPSSDDYKYYRDPYWDNTSAGTLERYKYFNGAEGNSPVSSGAYPTSSTTLPNTEDIDHDNNLNESEGYFQYTVKISPSDFQLTNVGNDFITNVVDGGGTKLNNAPVNCKWYELKIPIEEFQAKYGNIEDFKSIRFMRMMMRGFDKPVVLRFARVELVRGDWRKYTQDLAADGEYPGNDNAGTTFDISAVNYQENGTKTPVNYVLPPNIEQQLSYGSATPVHMNEQAMSLQVCNLQDGDARAMYKNVQYDVRSYKKLKMYVHAEAQAGGAALHDGDLTCFIRLGSDYTDNYYEYEIPMQVTAPGYYDNNSTDDREKVWKVDNNMELVFAVLQNLKQQRDKAIYQGQASLTKVYGGTGTSEGTISDPNGQQRFIYVKGNPNLAAITTIMIGVRNPKKTTGESDDGLPKCAEVWVNELRLTDFDEKGGWAATAHTTAKLADLGTLTAAGNYSTPGWGGIEQKVGERQRETRMQYDLSSQLLLNKFFPKSWGINLPMFVGYSQAYVKPQYNPYDPDILMKDAEADLPPNLRDSLKQISIDKTTRKSINFTNVKKERGKNSKKNNFYDIENFSFNYSFSGFENVGPLVQYHNMRDYKAGMMYAYATQPKIIQPFKNVKLLKKKSFGLIRDFNFYPYPNKFAMIWGIDRHYSEELDRNTTGLSDIPLSTYYDKHYNFQRGYDLKYDITKSLKMDFHADNTSRVLEPEGAITSRADKDTIERSLFSGGLNTMYSQHVKVDYALPLSKLPLTDWISANAAYSGDYKWTRALFSADSLGNMLTNGNQKMLNAQANMVTLYNKVPFLRRINSNGSGKPPPKNAPPPKMKKVKFTKGKYSFKKGKPRVINHKLGTKTVTLKVTVADTQVVKGKTEIIDENKIRFTPSENAKNATVTVEGTKPRGELKLSDIGKAFVRAGMMLKNVAVNVTDNEGQSLAGYRDSTRYMGLDHNYYNTAPLGLSPGMGFIFGQQQNFGKKGAKKDSFTDYAAQQGWLVKAPSLNLPYTQTKTQNIQGRANLEPIPGFKIELSANRNQTQSYSEFFRWVPDTNMFVHQSPLESGNFNMSFITIKTAFEKTNSDFSSAAFNQLLANRSIISAQLANHYGDHGTFQDSLGNKYHTGYGPTSQQTLMFAFLSAYSGKSASSYPLQVFPKFPLPNWHATYDGLTKIKPLKKLFKTISISSGYKSSYSFSYANNLQSGLSAAGDAPKYVDENDNYIFYEQLSSIIIAEQFAPLIKVDVTLHSSLQFNVEIKKDRNLALSFANNQLTEIDGKELILGSGYRWKNLVLKNPFKKGKSSKPIKSDLNLKANFSMRQNLTVIRLVDLGITQPTAGQIIYSIKTSADYAVTTRITVRLFCDWLLTNPRISTSFKTSNTNGGISIRFSLS